MMRHLCSAALFISCMGNIIPSPFSASLAAEEAATPFPALSYPFTLPQLPYATNALEPWIDKETMEVHWGKHHKAYVENLNAACEQFQEYKGKSLVEIFSLPIETLPASIRNNGGGHWNHSFFWNCMTSDPERKKMPIRLQKAIQASFGSLENMRKEMERAGLSQFGSGWVWLIQKKDGMLAITTTPNQDNPLMKRAAGEKGTPLLTIDVWEHAYYLKYQNKRAAYLDYFWNVVNWSFVESQMTDL